MTHNFSSPFWFGADQSIAAVTKLLFKVFEPYADASVTGWDNLFYEVN
jgi:hypothetical protein